MGLAVGYALNGLVLGALYVLVAVGLTLVFGVLRIPHFAHGVFVMVAAYLTFALVVAMGWNLLVAAPVVIVALGLLGLVLERVVYRPLGRSGELALMLAAFAVNQFVQGGFQKFFGQEYARQVSFPLDGSVSLGGVTLSVQRVIALVVALAATAVLAWAVRHTKFGRATRAVAEDPDAARISGINVDWVHRWVFVIATALAGLAGLLLATFVPITPFLGDQPLLVAFAIVVVGGMGSVVGATVVGLALGVVESLLAGFGSQSWSSAVVFLIIFVALIARPNGVQGARV
ncbi:branched-chain amino acid ABC transporter permease [Pseudonocardia ailaonensis]|uniref:Branched-chain amino acid ABC transporter permease n=1 Tax=Pseudonocardia ailaonensis TaxID=367279 RepID=A0ABN2N0R0_9PSEU